MIFPTNINPHNTQLKTKWVDIVVPNVFCAKIRDLYSQAGYLVSLRFVKSVFLWMDLIGLCVGFMFFGSFASVFDLILLLDGSIRSHCCIMRGDMGSSLNFRRLLIGALPAGSTLLCLPFK